MYKKRYLFNIFIVIFLFMFSWMSVSECEAQSLLKRLKKQKPTLHKQHSTGGLTKRLSKQKPTLNKNRSPSLSKRLKKQVDRKRSKQNNTPSLSKRLSEQKPSLAEQQQSSKGLTDRLSKQKPSLHDRISNQKPRLFNRLRNQRPPLYDRLSKQKPSLYNRLSKQDAKLFEQLSKKNPELYNRLANQDPALFNKLSQQEPVLYNRLVQQINPPKQTQDEKTAGEKQPSTEPPRDRGPSRSEIYRQSFEPENYRERYESENYRRMRSPFGFPNSRRSGYRYSYGDKDRRISDEKFDAYKEKIKQELDRLKEQQAALPKPSRSTQTQAWRVPMPQWMQNAMLAPRARLTGTSSGSDTQTETPNIDLEPKEEIAKQNSKIDPQTPNRAKPKSDTEETQPSTQLREENKYQSNRSPQVPEQASVKNETKNTKIELKKPSELLFSTGDSYFKQRRYDQAWRFYNNAAEVTPNNQAIEVRKALCLLAKEEYSKAGQILFKTAGVEPNIESLAAVIRKIFPNSKEFQHQLFQLEREAQKNGDTYTTYLHRVLSNLKH